MDTIKHFISFFLKAAFAFFLAAMVWWLVTFLYPSMSITSLLPKSTHGSTTDQGWLPSPKKYSSIFGSTEPTTVNTNKLVAPPAFDGYSFTDANNGQYGYTSYKYITYDASGNTIVTGEVGDTLTQDEKDSNVAPSGALPSQSPDSLASTRNLTIRNLSIYTGGHVYTGLSFIGEARSTMFRDGKFPIVMVDQNGRVVGVSAAVATTNWAVPGWTRFEAKIKHTLPNNTPCTMVFEEALTQSERISRQPLRIPLAMKCN